MREFLADYPEWIILLGFAVICFGILMAIAVGVGLMILLPSYLRQRPQRRSVLDRR